MPVDFDGLTSAAVLAAFGVPITYRPYEQATLPPGLRGVFDRTQIDVMLPDAVAPSSVPKTWLGVRLADFPPRFEHRPRDRIWISGITYDVVNALPDGQGWVYLELGMVGK